jgi:hypothetical protein
MNKYAQDAIMDFMEPQINIDKHRFYEEKF